jgi:hypothetical protein
MIVCPKLNEVLNIKNGEFFFNDAVNLIPVPVPHSISFLIKGAKINTAWSLGHLSHANNRDVLKSG